MVYYMPGDTDELEAVPGRPAVPGRSPGAEELSPERSSPSSTVTSSGRGGPSAPWRSRCATGCGA